MKVKLPRRESCQFLEITYFIKVTVYYLRGYWISQDNTKSNTSINLEGKDMSLLWVPVSSLMTPIVISVNFVILKFEIT